MNKLLIICGPTATGKTKLGIDLAKKFNGEIVSADSRQVYQGMDIGTGKDGLATWLVDVVKPDFRFNVADYKKLAEAAIEDILGRGKLPIIVGGTGFYIKAITEGIETIGIEPDWELRKILGEQDIKILGERLRELDDNRWNRMNESDRRNPRRLIRAIEIAQKIKNPSFAKATAGKQNTNKDTFFIGLTAPNEVLYQKIDQRVEERVEAGIEDEIKSLLKKGYNWENSAMETTIAYKEWEDYFKNVGARFTAPANNEIKKEIIQKWKHDEHNYARRQMTWFKKNQEINWFNITGDGWQKKVEKRVSNWYS